MNKKKQQPDGNMEKLNYPWKIISWQVLNDKKHEQFIEIEF